MNSPTFPAGVRSRRVWGIEGEAVGLRPEVLQDDGWRDARQSSDHEEDSQAAAHLLQVQKLRVERGGQKDQLVGAFCTLFSFFLKVRIYNRTWEDLMPNYRAYSDLFIYLFSLNCFIYVFFFLFLFVFPCTAITVESSFLLLNYDSVSHWRLKYLFWGGGVCFFLRYLKN